ncbi:MAG: T9SS type A sorting domain-containing protein [Bacteroidetes bacterium]|nr:T9SS type A sorting domain-containing protein [Bacteroidota bacterium]
MKRKIHKIVSDAKQGLFALALVGFSGTAAYSQLTFTFNYTGAVQNVIIPTGGAYMIEAWGAQGGAPTGGGAPGLGGYAKGEVTLTPGQSLNVYVGGQGISNGSPSAYPGGWNGGGSTAIGWDSGNSIDLGSGGGASDVRLGGTALSNRIIVAGGGGGSCKTNSYGNAAGGNGGGLSGGNGVATTFGTYGGGQGGTQSAGGAAGVNHNNYALAGSLGQGGNQTATSGGWQGSAGGGGYYGGGAGAALGSGGGGGSSYVGNLDNGVTTAGVNAGHGMVIITQLCAPPDPPVSLNSPQDLIICGIGGGITTLSVTGNGDLHWYNVPIGGTALDSGDVFVTPFVTTDTVFYASATTSCSSNRTAFHLIVLPKPLVSIITSTNAVCQGASISMIAIGNAVSYTWTGSGSNSPATVITPLVSGSYVVNVSAANGCTNTAVQSIIVNPLPVVGISPLNLNTICKGEVVKLQATGAQTYKWSSNKGLLDFGAEIFVSPDFTTTYSVTGTNENGCVSTSAGVEQKVDACVGITELGAMSGELRVYPNPSRGEFYFEGNFENGTQVVITNVLGQQVVTSDLNTVKNSVQIDTKGIYFYQILSNGNKITTGKLVVE